MSKFIWLLIVLFLFIFARVDAPNYQAFAQQQNTVVKKKKKKQVAKRDVSKRKNQEILDIPKPIDPPYGLPPSIMLSPSEGSGTGGGMGTGRGTGQGSGSGTGMGRGIDEGQDSGKGVGIGEDPNAVKCADGSETTPFRFLLRPKGNYTEQARMKGIQGTVRVRVVFNASGQVGAVTPITRLGFGLTEQAVAAARQIRFIPAKKCGVPISTTKVIDYIFNVY